MKDGIGVMFEGNECVQPATPRRRVECRRGKGGWSDDPATQETWWMANVMAATRTVQKGTDVTAAWIVLPEPLSYRSLLRVQTCDEHFLPRLRVLEPGDVLTVEAPAESVQSSSPLPIVSFHWPAHSPQWLHELLLSTEGVR